jgi:hypothetical protein
VLQPNACPWNVPVPVKAAGFVPLFEEHSAFNIQTDLSQIEAFGCREPDASSDELLMADLQTNFGRQVRGRLGSGRSGFFRDAYLKGIGRTTLAANWNRKDYLHNSGHLPASGAIREYVASEYIRCRALEHSIVACSGVLLLPVNRSLASYHRLLYGSDRPQTGTVPQVDLSLQAISIKSGCFARASNVQWLLNHLTPGYLHQAHSLSKFVELYAQGLAEGACLPAIECSQTTPASLADLQLRAIERAVRNFEAWFAVGLWWSSFANNFTLDGRFLDLETPAFAGGAIFGFLLPCDSGPMANSGVIGTEVFVYLAQMKVFLEEICRTLSSLPEWFDPMEREFAASLATELAGTVLGQGTLLGSPECAIERVVAMVRAHICNLSEDEARTAQRIVEQAHATSFRPFPLLSEAEAEAAIGAGARTFKLDFPPVLVQPGFRASFYAFGFNPEAPWHAPREEFKKGKAMALLMEELDECSDVDELLCKLQRVPEYVRQVEAAFAL